MKIKYDSSGLKVCFGHGSTLAPATPRRASRGVGDAGTPMSPASLRDARALPGYAAFDVRTTSRKRTTTQPPAHSCHPSRVFLVLVFLVFPFCLACSHVLPSPLHPSFLPRRTLRVTNLKDMCTGITQWTDKLHGNNAYDHFYMNAMNEKQKDPGLHLATHSPQNYSASGAGQAYRVCTRRWPGRPGVPSTRKHPAPLLRAGAPAQRHSRSPPPRSRMHRRSCRSSSRVATTTTRRTDRVKRMGGSGPALIKFKPMPSMA
jgi:hypothetical protein